MASLVSILIGSLALVLMIPSFMPLFGWLNWIFVPLALVGAGVGALSRNTGPRNFCLGVAALGMLRLWLGGGLI